MNTLLFILFVCTCTLLPAYQVQDESKDAWLTLLHGVFMSAFYMMIFVALMWVVQ